MPSPIPTPFLDFLARTYGEGQLTDAQRQIADETWAMAVLSTKPGRPSTTDLALAHAKLTDPLLDRVRFVRSVVHDTISKMTGAVPPDLAWAVSPSASVSVAGIHRPRTDFATDISARLRSGELIAQDTDFVRLLVKSYDRGTLNISLPLSSLSSDPMVLAQRTRRTFKEHAETLEYESLAKAKQNRDSLIRSIAGLQAELDSVNEIVRVKGAEEQARIDEIEARAHAKAATRAAERAARHITDLAAAIAADTE